MKVSRRNIIFTRCILWGGIALAVIGAVICYAFPDHLDWSLALLGGGLLISLLGAFLLKRLFRCPKCKKNVLPSDSSVDTKMDNIPRFCPYCNTPVELID